MKFDLIIETMQGIPTATFALILFMSLSAALLVNHILKVGIYTTIASVPALLVSGLFMHSTFVVHNILISPDKASNAAIATTTGFIVLAIASLVAYRIYSRISDNA